MAGQIFVENKYSLFCGGEARCMCPKVEDIYIIQEHAHAAKWKEGDLSGNGLGERTHPADLDKTPS